jgi:hypothetical protein
MIFPGLQDMKFQENGSDETIQKSVHSDQGAGYLMPGAGFFQSG